MAKVMPNRPVEPEASLGQYALYLVGDEAVLTCRSWLALDLFGSQTDQDMAAS